MKIKKGKMGWFIFSILIIIGFVVLSIYQLVKGGLNPTNLLMLALSMANIEHFVEKNGD